MQTDILDELLRSKSFLSWRNKPFQYIGKTYKNSMASEKHYTATEIADQWGVSADLVRSVFRDEPGVLRIDRPGTRAKRSYSTLRIPESVLVRVHTKLSSRAAVIR
jgi:hypothetical protein